MTMLPGCACNRSSGPLFIDNLAAVRQHPPSSNPLHSLLHPTRYIRSFIHTDALAPLSIPTHSLLHPHRKTCAVTTIALLNRLGRGRLDLI